MPAANPITVRTTTAPNGTMHNIYMENGGTVREALTNSTPPITVSAESEIRINGRLVNLDTPLTNGDFVIVSQKVKGNIWR